MENYGGFKESTDEFSDGSQGILEVDQGAGHVSSPLDAITRAPSWKMVVNEKGQLNVTV